MKSDLLVLRRIGRAAKKLPDSFIIFFIGINNIWEKEASEQLNSKGVIVSRPFVKQEVS